MSYSSKLTEPRERAVATSDLWPVRNRADQRGLPWASEVGRLVGTSPPPWGRRCFWVDGVRGEVKGRALQPVPDNCVLWKNSHGTHTGGAVSAETP